MQLTKRTRKIIIASVAFIILMIIIAIVSWFLRHGSLTVTNNNEVPVVVEIQRSTEMSHTAELFELEPGESRHLRPERSEYVIRFVSTDDSKMSVKVQEVIDNSNETVALELKNQKQDEALGADLTGCNYDGVAGTQEAISYPCDLGYRDLVVHDATSREPRYLSEFSDDGLIDSANSDIYATPHGDNLLFVSPIDHETISFNTISASNGRITAPSPQSVLTDSVIDGIRTRSVNGYNTATNRTDRSDMTIAILSFESSRLFIFDNVSDRNPEVVDLTEHIEGDLLYNGIVRVHNDYIYIYNGVSQAEGIGDAPSLEVLPGEQKVMRINRDDKSVEKIAELPDNVRVVDFDVSSKGVVTYALLDRSSTSYENRIYMQEPGQAAHLVDIGNASCWNGDKLQYIDANQKLLEYDQETAASYMQYSNENQRVQGLQCIFGTTYFSEQVSQNGDLLYHAKLTDQEREGGYLSKLLTLQGDDNILTVTPFKDTLKVVAKANVFNGDSLPNAKREEIYRSLKERGVSIDQYKIEIFPFKFNT